MRELTRQESMVVAIILASLALVLVGAALRLAIKQKAKPQPQASTPSWVWLFLILVVAMISYNLSGTRRPGRVDHAPLTGWRSLLGGMPLFGLMTVMFISFFGYLLLRYHDRVASRALKRGQAGDTEGAIAELRAAMARDETPEARSDGPNPRNPYAPPLPRRKPSAARANTMGFLHSMRQEWPEAYEWFLEAERIGGRQAHGLGNQGIALLKMGRSEEAATLLEEACSLAPQDALQPCNLGHVLIDLGRIDEAREQLARAEANLKKLRLLPVSSRKVIAAEVESLRKKIAADPLERDRAVFDEI